MKRITTAIFTVSLIFVAPAGADTVALWLFDDPAGLPIAHDSSGNGYHLTLGPDATIVAGGQFGGALDADATTEDGLGAFRYRAEKPLNPGDEDWTLECWLKAKPGMVADNRIWGLSGVNYIDYGRGDSLQGLFVASRYLPLDGVESWNKPTGDLQADNQFHHFAVVYDSTAEQLRHYFNGQLQFTAPGKWKDVPSGKAPYANVIMPPHYPMLQIGCRDAYQQWNHREIHQHDRHMKKFQGYIDEMRFSDEVVYHSDFTPPPSFARPTIHVWPSKISLVATQEELPSSLRAYFAICATGRASTQAKIVPDKPWLQVTSLSGSSKTAEGYTHATIVNTSTLATGKHTATLTVITDSENIEVPMTVTVLGTKDVIEVGDRKQLFIDERFIASQTNVKLHTNPPVKMGPLIENAHYPRNIVYLEDQKVWRMYLAPWSNLERAESTDGIHWKRFGQGEIVYESEQDPGKLIPLNFAATVMLDRQDIPERRFKAFMEVTTHSLDADGYEIASNQGKENKRSLAGVYAMYSSDGLRFKVSERVLPILPEFVSFAPQWDPNIDKYVSYFRCENAGVPGITAVQGCQFFYHYGFSYEQPEKLVTAVAPDTMGHPGFENLRSVARIEVDDLLQPWPTSPDAEETTMYATSQQVPMVFTADHWDGFADYYVHSTMVYPYAENVYLMFPTYFRHFHPSRQPYFHGFDDANGPLETVLAVSRDGKNWNRLDRKAYVELGRNDEWDRGRAMLGLGMVRHGNNLYQYYWGGPTLHDSLILRKDLPEPKNKFGGIGYVKQRLDGFVSADVDYQGGSLTTPPIRFSGNQLQINHKCGGQGTIFVELRDANGVPLPGFTLGDCEEVAGDDVAWEIRWRGSADISQFAGQPIRLHFKMRHAKLYAFQFVHTNKDE